MTKVYLYVGYDTDSYLHMDIGPSILYGFGGNDTLIGTDTYDVLVGGAGDDSMDGGNGTDIYFVSGINGGNLSEGFDTYHDTGTTGTDRIVAVAPGILPKTRDDAIADVQHTVDVSLVPPPYTDAHVDIGVKSFGPTSGIEIIDASYVTSVDVLGDSNNNRMDLSATTLLGHASDFFGTHYTTNIQLNGGAGNDTIFGSTGDDILVGGDGNDSLNGGEGSDTYLYSWMTVTGFSTGLDTIRDTGTTGTDTVRIVGGVPLTIGLKSFGSSSGIEVIDATNGGSTVTFVGDNNANGLSFSGVTVIGNIAINGYGGDDKITGSTGNDTINGGSGNDSLSGGDGADIIRGEDGNDTISGGNGNDLLIGGLGNNVLKGGAGADVFQFENYSDFNTITDFHTGLDVIQLNEFINLWAKLGTGALGSQYFHVGATATQATDLIVYDKATGALYYDSDGSGLGAAQQIAQLNAGTKLVASDIHIGF